MIHLVKLCVGAETVDDLIFWQQRVMAERRSHGEPGFPVHHTRQSPKRADELLDGGSIFWVIKGVILVRQQVRNVSALNDRSGRKICEIEFERDLVLTEPQGRKAFQGWRYLKPEDAPLDLTSSAARDVPPELSSALKDAGVW